MRTGDFPTQDICNPKKREEAFAWMLVAPPHMRGAALPFSSEYLQMLSGRLWDCGARPHANRQTIEWWPPAGNEPHWLTSPGVWVPKGTPRPAIDRKVNMVTVLNAMKKADEGDFLAALDEINKDKKK